MAISNRRLSNVSDAPSISSFCASVPVQNLASKVANMRKVFTEAAQVRLEEREGMRLRHEEVVSRFRGLRQRLDEEAARFNGTIEAYKRKSEMELNELKDFMDTTMEKEKNKVTS